MILEHEIPEGGKLYFAESAKLKRHIESVASNVLVAQGFDEIVTPHFSFANHQAVDNVSSLIRLSNSENDSLVLRADSSLDVVRLITKRLGRLTQQSQWFYIQPVFSYPSSERYQIGAESIDSQNIEEIIDVVVSILHQLGLEGECELGNVAIPRKIASLCNIDLMQVDDTHYRYLRSLEESWIEPLLDVCDVEDIYSLTLPTSLYDEVELLANTAKKLTIPVNLSPLFHPTFTYYHDIIFRIEVAQKTVAMGGRYHSEGMPAVGFSLYTDTLIEILSQKN